MPKKPFYPDADLNNADWPDKAGEQELMEKMPEIMKGIRARAQERLQLRMEGESVQRVPNLTESGKMSKDVRVLKGERSAAGTRTYWLMEGTQVLKSIVARTDEEADKLLNDN